MKITYVIIITLVTYIFGSINKIFIDKIPNKYIPIQNVLIGLVSGLICYFSKIETNLFQSIIMCLISTMGAGGIADLINLKKEGSEKWKLDY